MGSFPASFAQATELGSAESVVRAPRAVLKVALLQVKGKVDLMCLSYQVRSKLSWKSFSQTI